MYRLFIRPLLFLMPPETAHHFTFRLLQFLYALPGIPFLFKKVFHYHHPTLEKQLFGLRFPNPVGLAAGFDKDAKLLGPLSSMGFGFIEIGTVTPVAQPGNPQPRLFRLPEDKALVNRMGFNNQGVDAAAVRLKNAGADCIIGGNIGKNKSTPNQEAYRDYLLCFDSLYPLVDYFVVNVSSPNTPGLRALQEKGPLTDLIQRLQQVNEKKPVKKPILLKIAPDLTNSQLDDIIDITRQTGIEGIVATNTTIERKGLHTSKQEIEAIGMGGLSGKPLKQRSTDVIRYLHRQSSGKIPIIGVGGIEDFNDVREKLEAGASLVQVYTGFIYRGPSMVRKINKKLARQFSKSA